MTETNQFGNFGNPASGSSPPQKDEQFASGQILIGKYEVMSLIGVGGMGKVYKVRQVFLNKALALKVLDLHQTMSELQMRRFQLEAKAAFSLSHPNLVKVFDFGLLETEDPYLVMDFVDGITLHDHLKKEGPLTPEQCVKVFIQAASGLAYAHQRSVVHRDIKPSNIMLDAMSKIGANNSVKIVDFGIAKLSESGEVQGLTRTGEIFGSPLYMSPEQCSGESVDHRSDIYSLGCTLFEALTGTPPHVGNSALRTMMLHQTSPAPLLREASLGVTYPENLEKIVHRMLEKSPADRYQSLDDVVDDLNKALGQVAIVARPPILSANAKKAEISKTVSMSLVNFVLMIVAIMALTSAASIVIDRSLQRRRALQKLESVSPAPSKMTSLRPVSEQSGIPDYNENDIAREAEKASEAFTRAALIKPVIENNNGLVYRMVKFPDAAIGKVINRSFALPNPQDTAPLELIARGIRAFPPAQIWQLQIGELYSQALKDPSILKKIDPSMFQELTLTVSGADLYVGNFFNLEKQDEQVIKILHIVSSWTSLSGFSLHELDVTRDTINALNNLKKLEYLQLWQCKVEINALASDSLLQRLKYLSLCRIPCEEIIDSLSNSRKIESLSFAECELPVSTLEKLRLCPRLTSLDLRLKSLDQSQLDAIVKLKKLQVLSIRDSKLTPNQLKFLLAKCTSLKQLYLDGAAAEYVKEGLVEDSRITYPN